jgi:hypothetical protein
LHALFISYETKVDLVGIVAKDADYLELAFQAKIYLEQGYASTQVRLDNI